MSKIRNISSEIMGHHGQRGKGNIRAQKHRWRERKMFQMRDIMNNEDLARWSPRWRVDYAGYGSDNRDERAGKVIIHIGNEEYTGGFYIHRTGSVKIWYNDGGTYNKFIYVPIQFCQFTKRKEGNWNIYDVVVDKKKIDLSHGDDKQGGSVVEENDKGEVVIRGIKEKVSILDRVSGRTGAIYNKNREEGKLTELWDEFETALKDIDGKNDELKDVYVEIPALKKELDKKESEWHKELTSVGNILNKHTAHEKQMWDKTQSTRKVKGMKVNQKFKDSDVDEVRFNNMMDYIKQYPELQAQETIRTSINELQKERADIEAKNREYQQAIKTYNGILNKFEKRLQKTEDDLDAFEQRMKEAADRVNNHPYNKSKLFSALKTDYEKQATRLDTLKYEGKIKERENKLGIIKSELSDYKRKKFVDIEN